MMKMAKDFMISEKLEAALHQFLMQDIDRCFEFFIEKSDSNSPFLKQILQYNQEILQLFLQKFFIEPQPEARSSLTTKQGSPQELRFHEIMKKLDHHIHESFCVHQAKNLFEVVVHFEAYEINLNLIEEVRDALEKTNRVNILEYPNGN